MDGDNFFVTYESDDQSLHGLDELFHYYKICHGEVIVFSMEAKKVLNCRIYQVDGIEIDYYNRSMKNPRYHLTDCFWDFETVAGIYMHNQICFSLLCLTKGNVLSLIFVIFYCLFLTEEKEIDHEPYDNVNDVDVKFINFF